MGKKNKKFKSYKSHNTEKEIRNPQNIQAASGLVSSSENDNEKIMEVDQEKSENAILNEKYQYVRRDVRKLSLVVSILIILFATAYFVGIKTDFLSTAGDWIYKIGNFQIQ